MKYIANSSGIVFFQQGKPIKVDKSSPQYLRVIKIFDLPEDQQEQALNAILNQALGNYEKDGFKITPESVFYKGEELPLVLADKVRAILEEGLPITLFAKFWDNLQQNPSASSVRELYDFLAYKELPITEDGCFLAYKGLDQNYWSISGNTKTKVLSGKTNSRGSIHNGIGENIEVQRWGVDDNRENHCSFGLHVGSLEYAQSFSQGKVVVVKVNPKDVVSVPTDYECQKCRVCGYEVIQDFDQEITCPVTDDCGEEVLSEEKEEYSEFELRINKYLNKKTDQGFRLVSVAAIQNSFSPEYPSRIRVVDALNSLGYNYDYDENGNIVAILD